MAKSDGSRDTLKNPFRTYLGIALALAAVLFGGWTAWEQATKIGCLPAGGIPPAEGWMDTCGSDRIGAGYGHAAIWFDLEPTVKPAILGAKVLFFGDSRIMGAVSGSELPDWFTARHIPFYLLAFGFGEQSGWAEKLLTKYRPHPALLVFDADPYFTGGKSPPVQAIEADPDGERRTALDVKSFVDSAPTYCRYLSWLCGRTATSYRSYADGHLFLNNPERVWFGRGTPGNYPITPPPPADTTRFEGYLDHARAVLRKVPIDPRCVVFTLIPNSDEDDGLARFLANRLGARVISPHIDGLKTLDHWHLTRESSERWISAFFNELQPVLTQCVAAAQS